MKTIYFLTFFLLVSLSWIACKGTPKTNSDNASVTNTVDSVFLAKQADALHNIDEYTKVMDKKIQEVEQALRSADDNAKASIEAELKKYKGIQNEIKDMRRKVNKATPEAWEAVKQEFDDMHYNFRMGISDGKVNKEKAGQISN